MKKLFAVPAVAMLAWLSVAAPARAIYNYCYSNYQYCLSECAAGDTNCRLNCLDAYNACRYF
ncbi:MAG TPA: hypothetical protein VGH73_19490 [Thermoanaerobaculia bacterium]|jgi:hypothetical protein